MDASRLAAPEPVGITLFGTANLHVPALGNATVEHTCRVERDVRLYAMLPHMHNRGRRLELAFGANPEGLEAAYVRDPYDYDDQRFDLFERTLPTGSLARIRCTFENNTNNQVRFGESAEDEMCFAVGFRVGGPVLDFCTNIPPEVATGGVPRDPNAGACGTQAVESERGLGRVCTPGGNECPEDLFCAADLLDLPIGVCFEVGCTSNAQCANATCCTLPTLGSMANICVPEACRPDFCIPAKPD